MVKMVGADVGAGGAVVVEANAKIAIGPTSPEIVMEFTVLDESETDNAKSTSSAWT
jgi:hypothetical protein